MEKGNLLAWKEILGLKSVLSNDSSKGVTAGFRTRKQLIYYSKPRDAAIGRGPEYERRMCSIGVLA